MLQDLVEFAEKTGFHPRTIRRVFRSDMDTPSRTIPTIKLSKIVRDQTEAELSTEEAREAYFASKGCNPRCKALRTWISICATRGEILEAFYETEDRSDEERFALAVMNEIFIKDLEKVTTLEEATDILKDTPRESGIERAAFFRMYELYKKEEIGVAQ